MAKRGAHYPGFLISAKNNFASFEEVYGAANLADQEDWLMAEGDDVGVRIITAAPEIEGVMPSIPELVKRGIVYSIGHRYAPLDTSATVY